MNLFLIAYKISAWNGIEKMWEDVDSLTTELDKDNFTKQDIEELEESIRVRLWEEKYKKWYVNPESEIQWINILKIKIISLTKLGM